MRTTGIWTFAATVLLWPTIAMTTPRHPDPAGKRDPIVAPAQEAGTTGAARSLPYAHGRHFADLDAYLAFRRQQGAIDLPWYEEIEPGIFELRTSMRPPPPPQRFTRAALARKFGFDR